MGTKRKCSADKACTPRAASTADNGVPAPPPPPDLIDVVARLGRIEESQQRIEASQVRIEASQVRIEASQQRIEAAIQQRFDELFKIMKGRFPPPPPQ